MPKRDVEFVAPHTHCKVCGRPIPLNRLYCSRECMEKDSKQQRRAKRMLQLYLASVVILFILLLLYSLAAGGR